MCSRSDPGIRRLGGHPRAIRSVMMSQVRSLHGTAARTHDDAGDAYSPATLPGQQPKEQTNIGLGSCCTPEPERSPSEFCSESDVLSHWPGGPESRSIPPVESERSSHGCSCCPIPTHNHKATTVTMPVTSAISARA